MLGSPSPRSGLLLLGLTLCGCFDPAPDTDPTFTATFTATATDTAMATDTATATDTTPGTATDAGTTTGIDPTATTTGVDSGSTGDPDPDSSSGTTGGVENSIYEIQDGTIAVGEDVDVREVVVTGVAPMGIFVQEPPGGPYSGVFVVTGGAPGVARGDEVDVIGGVAEPMGQTVIDASSGSVTATGNTGIELVPEQVPIGQLSPMSYEQWEGVLVRVEGAPLTVTTQAPAAFTVETVGNAVDVSSLIYDVSTAPMDFPGFGVTALFSGIQGPLADGPLGHGIAPRDAMDLEGYQPPLAPEVHAFPVGADTSVITSGSLPWNIGDYYQGTRNTLLPGINSVDVHIDVETNGLSACGFQNAEVTINGMLAGDFTIQQGTVAIDETFMLPMEANGPVITVRYETTATVAGGCGAAGYSLTSSTITFNP